MEAAQAGEVVGARGPGLGSALGLCVMVVGDDVVDVAAPGRAGAPREHAGAVAELHLLADVGGDLVALRRQVGVEVDDGLDRHLRTGVGAPGADLVEQHEPLAVLHATRRTEHRLLAGHAGVEVGVDHDLPRGRQVRLVIGIGIGIGVGVGG
jgi:hypothetical protein